MDIDALKNRFKRFRSDRSGVAAVEFAIILPVMLLAYCGTVDITQLVMASRKVDQLALTLSDLTARASSLSPAELGYNFDAAQMVLAPLASSTVKMSIANIVIDAGGVARVCWSGQRNSTVPARGTTVVIPDSMRVPNTSVIMAKASYDYSPITSYVFSGFTTLGNDPIYTRPRGAQAVGTLSIEQVQLTGTAPCPNFS